MILERLLKPQASISTSSELDAFLRLGQNTSASGVVVNEQTALAVTSVYACVRVLAESIAQTPLIVYRRLGDGGKERAPDHWLYPILHQAPNEWMTAFGFKELMEGHVALRGNAYAFINRRITGARSGQVRELLPIHPDRVDPEQNEQWRLKYKVRMPDGDVREFRPAQILHLPGLSFDGVKGASPLQVHRNAIGFASATDTFGSKLFNNGARPGGVLKHPKTLSDTALSHLKDSLAAEFGGAENAFKTLVLEEDMSWTQVGMTSEDAQYLETRKFQIEEIARIFRVPAVLLQHSDKASTYASAEQFFLSFVKFTLAPWFVRWEQALTQQLLPEAERDEFFIEFLAEGLLRGDTRARYDGYASAITNGWMTRNEARVRENMNPLPGLDEPILPLNMTPEGEESDADQQP